MYLFGSIRFGHFTFNRPQSICQPFSPFCLLLYEKGFFPGAIFSVLNLVIISSYGREGIDRLQLVMSTSIYYPQTVGCMGVPLGCYVQKKKSLYTNEPVPMFINFTGRK